jgi:hypothetical protein
MALRGIEALILFATGERLVVVVQVLAVLLLYAAWLLLR